MTNNFIKHKGSQPGESTGGFGVKDGKSAIEDQAT